MDPQELAKNFLAEPTKEVLEKITELVKENPAAAVGIVGMMGFAYITKLTLEAVKPK
ncbi:hypothetical protein [Comamonas testosteroni]|uniref:hypothetical protein n=1 Tax=Comamonas testosteroni TaxID=285 RepID=UPI002DBBFA33|nr:hypothetical protein [Comamonas testosteroni]MEB5964508.1 hypothetical protein [Comamonas testosteroni]